MPWVREAPKEPTEPPSEPKPKTHENPDRHARLNPQPIQYMRKVMNKGEFCGFCLGNIIKYACRIGYKETIKGNARKIEDYARWLAENENGSDLTFRDKIAAVDELVNRMMGREGDSHDWFD